MCLLRLLAIVSLSSCCVPAPHRVLVTAPVRFEVVQPDGGPLANARIRLLRYAYPYRHLNDVFDTVTNDAGVAAFEASHTWQRAYPLMMHGVAQYAFEWCIDDSTWGSARAEVFDPERPSRQTVQLTGAHIACPADLDGGI